MYIYLFGALVILISVALYLFLKKKKSLSSLNLVLLYIRVPRITNEEGKKGEFLSQINSTEQLFASLASLNEPFTVEVSVHNKGEQISFYIAVSRKSVDFVSRQIQGLFPGSNVDLVPDYTVFDPDSHVVGGEMVLKENFILPLRTYKEAEVDTFAPIVSTLSKLDDVGQGASIQLVFEPMKKEEKKIRASIVTAIEELKAGKALRDVLKNRASGEFRLFYKGTKKLLFPDPEKEDKAKVVDDEAIKAVHSKLSKQLFFVNVRLVVSAKNRDIAEDVLLSIAGSISQLSSVHRNSIQIVKHTDKSLRKMLFRYAFREFDKKTSIVLNTEEIASIYHLPTSSTDVPRIGWIRSKEAPPPEVVPTEGVVLGESVFRGDRRLIRMTNDDRRRHLYVIGQTGTGKSVFLKNLINQDMKAGHGVCFIDPHGADVLDILGMVPKERINDVIYFDPGDLSRPLGLNMLEYDFNKPEQKSFIINEIQAIFNQLFDKAGMGPMFERYMRNSLELLMGDAKNEPATLIQIPRLFTDDAYRERKLARCTNPSVIDFWEKEASKASGDWSLANMVGYIASKFDNFITNAYMRPIIGQEKSAFNFREIMDSGKIILVNLSKGKIGDLNSQLLGMIIVGKILEAAFSRQELIEKGQTDFKDFFLYMDEFQNITTDSIESILSEARKYRLCLTVAHQYIAQLKDEIREAVFGNVGSKVSFRVGSPDTETLLKEFSPEFNDKDLIGVENLNCLAKLLINGIPSKPFNMFIPFPPRGNPVVCEKLKELSRLTYGRDATEIEKEIVSRLRD